MGFILSIFYFVICYLTPVGLFGPVVIPFRIELILAAVIFLISLPALIRSFVTKTPQAIALVGLAVAVFSSVLIGMRWPGGAVTELFKFIPAVYAFFLIALHCDSMKKFKVLVVTMFLVCVFVIVQANLELMNTTTPQESEAITGFTSSTVTLNTQVWNGQHPYLLAQQTAPWEWIYRIRGLGVINDPNDFGQLLLCVTPLLFIFWQKKRFMRNFVFVILPASILLYGIFLTRSRGALVALIAVVVVTARRRFGTIPALIVAAGLFVGAMAFQFTGGRAISADAGSDRTALWGASLQVLKTHPLFGIGADQLPDVIGQTAHNSILVCAAELGTFGLFFWTLFLFPTVRDVYMISKPIKAGEAVGVPDEEDQSLFKVWRGAPLDRTEINRIGYCLLVSLTGFLVAGWFLSRAFVMAFFLLGGLIEVIFEAARRQGMVAPRLPLAKTVTYSFFLMIALTTFVYISVLVLNFLH